MGRDRSQDLRSRRDGDRLAPPLLRTRVRIPRASGIKAYPATPDRLCCQRTRTLGFRTEIRLALCITMIALPNAWLVAERDVGSN